MSNVDQQLKLNEICEADSAEPVVIYFRPIDADIMRTIELILSINGAYTVLLDYSFDNWASANQHDQIGACLGDVWTRTEADLRQLVVELDAGDIQLTRLDDLQARHFNADCARMHAELAYLMTFFRASNVTRRSEQLTLYEKYI